MFESRFGLRVRSALLLLCASCAPAPAHTPPPPEGDAVVTIPAPTAAPTAAPEPETKVVRLPAIEVSDEPAAVGDTPPAAPSPSEDELEERVAVIQGLAPGIRRCFENGLKRDPTMNGSLRMSVDVGAQGQVTAVRPVAKGFSQEVVDCIVARAKAARFKPPKGGAATITIPVVGRSQ